MISYRGLKKQGSQTVVDKLFTDRHRDIKKRIGSGYSLTKKLQMSIE